MNIPNTRYTAWNDRADPGSVWDLEASCYAGWYDIVATLAKHLPIDTAASASGKPGVSKFHGSISKVRRYFIFELSDLETCFTEISSTFRTKSDQ